MRYRSTSFVLLALGLTVPLALGGCGAAASKAVSAGPKAAGPKAAGADAAGSVPAAHGLPAVLHATDLKTAPVIQPGPGTPEATLVTRDLVTGTGTVAVITGTVRVQYVGALYPNGKVFDATWARGAQPTSFPLGQVVPGFAQGIVGMKVGGRREIVIPPSLGYGSQANGPIPASSTLVFIVDLVAVQ